MKMACDADRLPVNGAGDEPEAPSMAFASLFGSADEALERAARRATWFLIAALLASLIVPGVVPAAAQQTRPLHVIASFSILADVAQPVAGDAGTVESLVPRGANPHSYEPSAQDVVALSEADAVLIVGMTFESTLRDVLDEAAGDRVMVVSGCVPVQAVPKGVVLDHGDDHAGGELSTPPSDLACDDHAEDVRAAFGLDDLAGEGALGLLADVDCAEAGCDPHVWTDPVNTALWALAIRDVFGDLDPANAAVYAANATAYLDELAALHGEITALIDSVPLENRVLVTNHAMLSYFAVRYGLDQIGVVIPGGSTASEPTVQDVLALVEAIQAANVPAIFTETTTSDDLAQQIADEAGAAIVTLYTGSLSDPGGKASTYLDYMRFNATQIAGALK